MSASSIPIPPAELNKKQPTIEEATPDTPAVPEDAEPAPVEEPKPFEGTLMLDPSQFEPDEPLPRVTLPQAETPLSIAEALERDSAGISNAEEKDEPTP